MSKRISAFILSALMLCILCLPMAGCEETSSSSVTGYSRSEEDTFFGLDLPTEVDFGGRTVRVLTTSTEQSLSSHQIKPTDNSMFDAEKASSVINTALECTRIVEEELNIVVEEEVIYTFSRYGGEMYQRIHADAMSGTNDYVFAMPCSIEAGMLSIDGLLYALNKDVPFINLENEWWCDAFNDAVTVNGNCYYAMSDIGTVGKDATLFMAFNKKMAESYNITEKYGYNNLYEMVDAMAWTQDVMYEMAASVYQDTNSNNICDLGDINGLSGQDSVIYNMLGSANVKIVDVGNDGYPVLTIDNEKAYSVIGEAQEYFKSPRSGFISANDYFNLSKVPVRDCIVPEFKADRLLFFMDAILNLENIRDMESDFGVIPTPLYDKNQDHYGSRIGCWSANCIVVPTFVTDEDLEIAGYLIEALSAVSREKLNPVYYEQTLQYQISRDDDSMRMLDIIFENRTCELAEIYNMDVFNTVCGMLKAPQDTFASAYQSVKEQNEIRLQEITEAYKDHENR